MKPLRKELLATILGMARDGKSAGEIGDRVGMTRSAVCGVLYRARAAGDGDARCWSNRSGQAPRRAALTAAEAAPAFALMRAGLPLSRAAARCGFSEGQLRGAVDRHWPAGEARPRATPGPKQGMGPKRGAGAKPPAARPQGADGGAASGPARTRMDRWPGGGFVRAQASQPDAALAVALIDRRSDQCAYPLDARDADGRVLVCGGRIGGGGSWCGWHRRIVYVQPEDRARIAAAREAAAAKAWAPAAGMAA